MIVCDSDALVSPNFIQSIINAFDKEKDIVLHLDEVRNKSKKFYPFNYPSIDEIIEEGCINFNNGKTTGLLDREDMLHTRNYGACMCALRKDLIDIGGADEHIDYLGHICGPYEMTFRLINAGKKEIWHQSEFLYHTWHPGTDGCNNYLGPHDGRNMSMTALEIIRSARVMPLVENKIIRSLRMKEKIDEENILFSKLLLPAEIEKWDRRKLKKLNKYKPKTYSTGLLVKIIVAMNIIQMSIKQLFFKTRGYSENKIMPKSIFFKFQLVFIFFFRMLKNNKYAVIACKQAINKLVSDGEKEIAFYGVNDVTKVLIILAKNAKLKIVDIYGNIMVEKKAFGFCVSKPEDATNYKGKIIIASFIGIMEKAQKLEGLGIKKEKIIRLQ